MQFDIDMQSVHKELFLEVRDYLLSFEGVEETKKNASPRMAIRTVVSVICEPRKRASMSAFSKALESKTNMLF